MMYIANCGLGAKALNPKSEIRNPQLKGFTLLEVMVAVSIMAMVLVTLLGLKNRTMQHVAMADRITTATMLAKRVMTETLLTKPTKPEEGTGEFSEDEYKEYTWKKNIAPFPEPLVQIMEVHVAVLWKDGEREESVELVSYE